MLFVLLGLEIYRLYLSFVLYEINSSLLLPCSRLHPKTHPHHQSTPNIMQEYPNIIDFSLDGTELVIENKAEFINVVLKNNFRHQNWRSFIRQLNMYSFRKINRGMDKEIFVNPLFQRGNDINYHKIRRKINTREEQESYEKKLQQNVSLTLSGQFSFDSSLPFFMNNLFDFRSTTESLFSTLRKDVDNLVHKKKGKDTKSMVHDIKECFQMIEDSSQKLTNSLEKYNDKFQFSDKQTDLGLIFPHTPMKVPTSILKPQATTSTLRGIDEEEEQIVSMEKDEEEELQRKRYRSLQMLGHTQASSFNSVKTLIN